MTTRDETEESDAPEGAVDGDATVRPYTALPLGRETIALFVVLALVGAVLFATVFLDLPGWWRGDTDLFGNYRRAQQIEQRQRQFTPLERVHAELFPDWIIYLARPADRRPAGEPDKSYENLRSELDDEELLEILSDLRELVASGLDHEDADAVVDAMDRWNRRLEQLDEPYFARLRMTSRRGRRFVVGAFYRRMAQPAIRIGNDSYETLLLRRIDNTNLVEGFLGLAREDVSYAFVVTDRILDFATDEVLPVVAADTEPDENAKFSPVPQLNDVASQFDERVRDALRRGLGEERYEGLRRAARARVRLGNAVDSIRSRRDCSDFRISNPPWNGYAPRTLDRLDSYANHDKIQSCPTVTYDEADAIRSATEQLQTDPAREAFESAVALLSRIIAIHEVRHRADQRATGSDAGPPCEVCPAEMSKETRSELSAYTASFAWSDSPALALFQACSASKPYAHRSALAYFLDELGTHCNREIPDNLGEKSRALEQKFFGRSEQVLLPDEFPDRLEIRVW